MRFLKKLVSDKPSTVHLNGLLFLNKWNQNPKKEASGAVSLSRMADLIVYQGLLKPWNIDQIISVERDKS